MSNSMIRAAITIALILCTTTPANAQGLEQQARDQFFAARNHAAAGRHSEAVALLDDVVRKLGKPKQRVLPLLATSLTRLAEYERALETVQTYFKLVPPPDPNLAEHSAMVALHKELVPLAAAQAALFARVRGPDLAPYHDYLAKHPNGKNAAAVRKWIPQQQSKNAATADDAAFAAALQHDTVDSYAHYLSTFRLSGRHVVEAQERQGAAQARDDDAAFATASMRMSANAYREYLRAWPSGRHVDAANGVIYAIEIAERRTEGLRLMGVSESLRREASGARSIGGVKIGVGLLAIAGSVAILATGVAGEYTSTFLGIFGIGVGGYVAISSLSNFKKASRINDDARSYRDRATPLLTGGDRRVGIEFAHAF